MSKTKGVKLAWCMIVKPTDDEAELLARALKYIAPHVDGIFLTITGKNKRCEEVAAAFNAHVSYFEWCHDFSAARNFNFSQVPDEYTHIGWCDCDDAVRNADKLKPTIQAHPEVDCFTLNYLYAFDERKNPTVVHLKTRILKNDKCVEWVGALHEDFKENREVKRYFVNGIDILHLSNTERFAAAKTRNVDVSRKDMEKNPDDPRSYWNLGNSLFAAGETDEAIKMFDRFMALSRSDEEKYIIRLRIAEAIFSKGEKDRAL